MRVVQYDEALSASGSPSKTHLVLGNGFSISLKPTIFTYGSLLESADFSSAPYVRRLFDVLDTQDFELVIKHLVDAARVVKIYRPSDVNLASKLEADAELVKDALVTAIAKRHPDRPYDIETKHYVACRRFLARFDHIYTLNYDVLLYWTLMHNDVDSLALRPDDGFRHPELSPDEPYVSWQQGQIATVYYLHGALHLFDSGSQVIKYTWSKTDVPLVEQIRSALDDDKYPLFVAEGTSSSKLDKIMHSAYLHKGVRSLESCADNARNCIVMFGHSLADNDEHILRCIGRGKIPKLLVSVYGDPTTEANKLVEQNANKLVNYRSSLNGRYPLEVIFYDASSAHVWG